ncbi:hypothetical protein SBADM41S_11731 [Streptomyces badius]
MTGPARPAPPALSPSAVAPTRPTHPHLFRTEESQPLATTTPSTPTRGPSPPRHTPGPSTTYGAPLHDVRGRLRAPPQPAEPAGQPAVTPADAADAARLVSFGPSPSCCPPATPNTPTCCGATGRRAPSPGSPTPSPPVSASSSSRSPARRDGRHGGRGLRLRRPHGRLRPPRLLRRRRPLPARSRPPRHRRPRLPPPRGPRRRRVHRPHHGQRRRRLRTPGRRRLEERAEERARTPTRPATPRTQPAGGLRPPPLHRRHQGRPSARRIHHRHHRQGRRLLLTDSGFLQRTGNDAGGAYLTAARYPLQVRDLAGRAAMAELLELGVVPVSDSSATLLPPPDPDSVELAADAGLPFHS